MGVFRNRGSIIAIDNFDMAVFYILVIGCCVLMYFAYFK